MLAGITHALIISAALTPGWRAHPLLEGDALTYIKPAQNLQQFGVFSREDRPPFLWEPYRTPGYPLLIAFSLLTSGQQGYVLYFSAITASLAAFCAVRLAREWGGTRRSEHLAGLLVAFLPNSLGLAGLLLTDALTGHLTLVWIYTLWQGLKRSSTALLTASAIILLALQSLKPTFFVAAALIFLVGCLRARSRANWIKVTLLIGLTLPLPLFLAIQINRDHGVFSANLLSVSAAREYLQSRSLAEQNDIDYTYMTAQIRAQDWAEAATLRMPPSIYGRLYLVQSAYVDEFFRQQPIEVLHGMTIEFMRQFAAPQEIVFQLFWGNLVNWGRAMGSLLTLGLFSCAFFAAWRLGKAGDWTPSILLIGVILFFLASSSLSTRVGGRLRFPADMVALPLAAVGIEQFIKSYTPWAR